MFLNCLTKIVTYINLLEYFAPPYCGAKIFIYFVMYFNYYSHFNSIYFVHLKR